MNYKNLIDLSLDELVNIIFEDSFFKEESNLKYLDIVLKSNFVSFILSIDKDKLLKLSKVIVNANSFLLQTKFINIEEYKNRWKLLSELCFEYSNSKSTNSVYEDIGNISIDDIFEKTKKYGLSSKIIKVLYNQKVLTVSEIGDVLGKQKQYTTQLLSKLDEIGVIKKSTLGKNKLVRLTSIGMSIYEKFFNTDYEIEDFSKYKKLWSGEETIKESPKMSNNLLKI